MTPRKKRAPTKAAMTRAAMPGVQRLVEKFSRQVVGACLNTIRDAEYAVLLKTITTLRKRLLKHRQANADRRALPKSDDNTGA